MDYQTRLTEILFNLAADAVLASHRVANGDVGVDKALAAITALNAEMIGPDDAPEVMRYAGSGGQEYDEDLNESVNDFRAILRQKFGITKEGTKE